MRRRSAPLSGLLGRHESDSPRGPIIFPISQVSPGHGAPQPFAARYRSLLEAVLKTLPHVGISLMNQYHHIMMDRVPQRHAPFGRRLCRVAAGGIEERQCSQPRPIISTTNIHLLRHVY